MDFDHGCVFALIARRDVCDDLSLARELAARCGVLVDRAIIGNYDFLLGPSDRNPMREIYRRYEVSVRNCATREALVAVQILEAKW